MLLSTTPTIEGHTIREYKGIVTGETIIGANFMKDFFAGIVFPDFRDILDTIGDCFGGLCGSGNAIVGGEVGKLGSFPVLIMFVCLVVCVYYAWLLIRRKRLVVVATTVGGQQVVGTVAPLSVHDTEKLVAENPVKPPSALDQKMMESIRNLKK